MIENWKIQSWWIVASLALGALPSAGVPSDAQALTTYDATYRVELKGLHVADARFSLRRGDSNGEYVFETTTKPRGLASLVRRRKPSERSRFEYDGRRLRPIAYELRDGTRKGKDDSSIRFDWQAGVAASEFRGETVSLPLEGEVLDRLSLQANVMKELSAGRQPTSYALALRNELKVYRFTHEGSEVLETAMGEMKTERYVQQRDGSSRRVIMWLAPSLSYLAVRIEQQRKGKTQAVFSLLEAQGVDRPSGQFRFSAR